MIKVNKQRVYNFYNKKKKWMGLIDNKTVIFFITYLFVLLKLVSLFKSTFVVKIYLVAIFVLPLVIFIILNLQEENIIDKLGNIIFFYISRGYYLKSIQTNKLNNIYVKNVEKYRIEKLKQK